MHSIPVRQSRDGALLIALIVALVGASVLGVALLSMATSARYQRIHVGTATRAYYLAESGGAYVRSVRMDDRELRPSGTFTLHNGDQFVVHTFQDGDQVIVRSTGITNPGTYLEARRRLHFVVSDGSDSDELPFDFDFDDDGQFDDDVWTTVNVDPTIRSTGPSGGQPALDLKGEQGEIYLNWQDHPELDLQQIWAMNGGLLSYDLQVKIKPFDTGSQAAYSKHYMLGLSFRLHPDIENSYGISYFRSLAGTNPGHTPSWVRDLPPAFQALRGNDIYLVLWYRNGWVSSLDLLDYRLLTPADPVVEIRNNNPELRDYSTLLLQFREQYNAAGTRENRITAFIQGLGVYPLWNDREDIVWQEDETVFPGPVVWQSGRTLIPDGRLTSETFDLVRPAEIGVHVLYDLFGANLKFFDDFAMRMEGYGSIGGSQIQY